MSDATVGKHRQEDDAEKGLSRRAVLGIGVAAVGAAAASSVLGVGSAQADVTPPALTDGYPKSPAGSTLAKTKVRGTPGVKGYRKIVDGPAEASQLRTELSDGAVRSPGTRVPLVAFGQFTDMHLVDAQSPARVEFLDPLGSPIDAAYRAQEMLTLQVAESMVRSMNSFSPGAPASNRPLDFLISTGDNADNTQYNEVRWHIDILDGGKSVRPDSGSLTKWEGVQGKTDGNAYYWHPDGTPKNGIPDQPHTLYGFPNMPGLLDRCRAPFFATGLHMPWYTVFGNHDGLVQGNIPAPALFSAVATGPLKVTGVPTQGQAAALINGFIAGDPNALLGLLTLGPAKIVSPDLKRRTLTHAQVVHEYFTTSKAPVGHGYTQANVNNGTAYYSFNKANVHFISLDTCDTFGYSEGSIDHPQLDWLTAELKANSSRYLDATTGAWVNTGNTDKLMVIFSHHTVATMTNPIGLNRVNGTTVEKLLLQFPNVVLWVNGHTHRNTVVPHARPSGAAFGGGFWEVNTAAHIDWPQQGRVLEIVDNSDGTLSVFGTIIDHLAGNNPGTFPSGPLGLASLSRELGANDWQNETPTATEDGKRGALTDRNVELLLRRPF